jgi:hypothetical protein
MLTTIRVIALILVFTVLAQATENIPNSATPIFKPEYSTSLLDKLSRPAFIGCTALDFVTTRAALNSSPSAREINPILGQSPVRQAVTMAAITAGVLVIIHVITRRGHRKSGTVMATSFAAGRCAVAAWNVRQK